MPKPSAAYPTSGPCWPGSYYISKQRRFIFELSYSTKANENSDYMVVVTLSIKVVTLMSASKTNRE